VSEFIDYSVSIRPKNANSGAMLLMMAKCGATKIINIRPGRKLGVLGKMMSGVFRLLFQWYSSQFLL